MHPSEHALFVFCSRPGLIRAGMSHAAVTAHKPGAFTRPQLEEMLREPAITLIVGQRVLSEHLSDYLGVVEAGSRTHVVGSSVDTDAGASMVTDVIAQENVLRSEVERVEARDVAHRTDGAVQHASAETPRAGRVRPAR